ncbi:MAG: 3-oxoacid CoA-transferase [Firmicutes bacterium]|nr:3-oxoacid CoA-transferase [Bacillota bacterium]NLY39192.1 3-oxoacid CoA-transferase [Bacillota bacterium]
MTNYNQPELLACISAKMVVDNKGYFVGSGIPLISVLLAKKTHAPNAVPFFETGSIGPKLEELPISIADSKTMTRAIAVKSMCDIFELSTIGVIEYGFLGGAQVDMYGNLNATMIGDDYYRPKVRLPGSGGACDVGSLCGKTIILMLHEKRRFVPRVDFITTPGYLEGGNSREERGFIKGTGPYRVITNLAVMDFEEESKRMRLLYLLPGATVERVVENTGFELIIPDHIETLDPPTREELQLLREVLDPTGLIIGRQLKN